MHFLDPGLGLGLGLGLVSDLKSEVSVLSQSRTETTRLQPCMETISSNGKRAINIAIKTITVRKSSRMVTDKHIGIRCTLM